MEVRHAGLRCRLLWSILSITLIRPIRFIPTLSVRPHYNPAPTDFISSTPTKLLPYGNQLTSFKKQYSIYRYEHSASVRPCSRHSRAPSFDHASAATSKP